MKIEEYMAEKDRYPKMIVNTMKEYGLITDDETDSLESYLWETRIHAIQGN